MRNAFAAWLCERAELDERVLLLTGDLGFTVLERFVERYPRRFFNVGVAEQNMIGLATGLAEAGFRPFAYSIASFASMRPYEFIRNGPVLHRLPVCVVGVGGGLDYGHNGVTHFALEDVALMRVQPDITTVVPADREQARSALEVIAALERPVYLRLGRTGEPVPGLDGAFALGRVALLAPGRDVLLVALGPQVHVAQAAAGLLRDAGVEAAVALVSSFNPSPDEDLRALLAGAPLAVTLEGHYRTGGLGSYVSELVAEAGFGTRVRRIGVEAMPRGLTGSESFLAQRLGLDAAAAARAALDGLGAAEAPALEREPPLLSLVLPVYNQGDHIRSIVESYSDGLAALPLRYELILVVNGGRDRSLEECRALAAERAEVSLVELDERGWGRAVRAGVAVAEGDIVCFTNSARTTREILVLMLAYSLAYPEVVLKANRRIRESRRRRIGSLLYNIECRTLFDLSVWDINGTPKIFPRRCAALLALRRDDDLLDLEFNVVCARNAYPMIEVPILATERHGGRSTTNASSALRMYLGAWLFRRELRRSAS